MSCVIVSDSQVIKLRYEFGFPNKRDRIFHYYLFIIILKKFGYFLETLNLNPKPKSMIINKRIKQKFKEREREISKSKEGHEKLITGQAGSGQHGSADRSNSQLSTDSLLFQVDIYVSVFTFCGLFSLNYYQTHSYLIFTTSFYRITVSLAPTQLYDFF